MPPIEVHATTTAAAETDADTVVIGLVEGEGVPHDTPGGELSALLDAGEARTAPKKLAVTHAAGKRWILVGLGERDALDHERARQAAAVVVGRAQELGARALCWEVPHKVGDDVAGALVEGTLLAAYRYDAYREPPKDARDLERLLVSAHHDVSAAVARATVLGEAANAARDLQNAPANELTPTRLAERAQALAAAHDTLSCEVEGRDGIEARGMGAFAAVARGADAEPALITLRYDGPSAAGPVVGLVGKAVTFDTGGISLKPPATMHEMKFDMSGGAAVLEAVGALSRLGAPVRVVAVIGATENMPSGRATRPGDIVRSKQGLTIEVNNTDAEGRLVLADCLVHAREQGAERLVDVATLTGAILVALGRVHAGLFTPDDDWAAAIEASAEATGELVHRLPLHAEHAEKVKGEYADLTNLPGGVSRHAASTTAAEFLKRFAGDVPWAHLDIAGTAWSLGRPYAKKGGSGWGVRLLVDLVERAGRA